MEKEESNDEEESQGQRGGTIFKLARVNINSGRYHKHTVRDLGRRVEHQSSTEARPALV